MSSVTADFIAQTIARRLEDKGCGRSGVTLALSRASVARATGVAAGTLENLRRGRIKGVRAWIFSALRAALIAELEAELARNEHELAVLRLSARRLDQEQVAEVEAGLASLRKLMSGENPSI